MNMRSRAARVAAGLLTTLAACGGDRTREEAGGAAAPAVPPPPPPELRVEVDVAARELRLFRREQLERTYGVAVGRPEWPTQNGEWRITTVVWNPGWTPPPDEEWTKDEEPKDPGDPDNPLGRVQMLYDPPRTIHGTNDPSSIGKAVSHGSIRMRNEEAAELARMLMEAGGARRDAAFFQEVERNRTRRYEVPIPNPIPIRVINGAENADAVEGERDPEPGRSGTAAEAGDPAGRTGATPSPRAEPRRDTAAERPRQPRGRERPREQQPAPRDTMPRDTSG